VTDSQRISLLHEDDALVVVSKPPGIAVIPGRDEGPGDSLRGQLETSRGEKLFVVHRIDRDTSGIVVFARTAAAHRTLSMAFEHREVTKSYVAYTLGARPSGTITTPLHTARKGRMRPAHPGEDGSLPSETEVNCRHFREVVGGTLCRVEASPKTGRQHQLRVHLRSVGAPLVVDPFYGPHDTLDANALGPGAPAIPRLTLHAATIAFTHPATGRPFDLEAPLPPDLRALDTWLRSG